MTKSILTAATPLALLLAACASEPPPAPESAASREVTREAAPRQPTGPVTKFDGRYVGTVTLNPDRTRACPSGPSGEREIIVSQGQVTFPVRPEIRQTLNGTVTVDGSARMSALVDREIATTGLFTDHGFQGEYRNGLCSYAVQMQKVT